MATRTATTTTPSHSLVLVDYELHRSSPPPAETRAEEQTAAAATPGNPPDWPTDHRRIPDYRPINYDLDRSERIVFSNRIEHAFIRTMFFGIQVVTVFHRSWTNTAGKLTGGKTFFHYELGGEY